MKTFFKILLISLSTAIFYHSEVKGQNNLVLGYKVWAKTDSKVFADGDKYGDYTLLKIILHKVEPSFSLEMCDVLVKQLKTNRCVTYQTETDYFYVEVYQIKDGKFKGISNRTWRRYVKTQKKQDD